LFYFSEVNPNDERLARLIRIYRSPIPRRAGATSALTHSRAVAHSAPRSLAPVAEPVVSQPAPPPPPVRPPRRMSPIVRTKSPPKVTRRVESPPKIVRRDESPPKRPIVNENINIERLKLARDEAERAMKVINYSIFK